MGDERHAIERHTGAKVRLYLIKMRPDASHQDFEAAGIIMGAMREQEPEAIFACMAAGTTVEVWEEP